jgi:protoheme IX farnesyltransferase
MERNQANQAAVWGALSQSITDFGLLVKFRLNLTVVFSAVMSYAIVAEGQITVLATLVLALGGFFVTSAANALNQVLERDYDLLMPRTANRPVAAGRMSVSKAVLLAGLMALVGISLLSVFNPLTGFLGTLSLISYAFVYTPLKRSSPLAVLVGAIPGALPLIIGSVAYEGTITSTAMMLFSLQFLWQFPHFWAVAWLADEDYRKAGFYLLPTGAAEKDKTTGLLSFGFCLLLIANTFLAFAMGYISLVAMVALVVLNVYWALKCWNLYKTCSVKAARAQMFFSFAHLPMSLIVLLLDKLF